MSMIQLPLTMELLMGDPKLIHLLMFMWVFLVLLQQGGSLLVHFTEHSFFGMAVGEIGGDVRVRQPKGCFGRKVPGCRRKVY
ncbi:MAG: hypothetical protein J3Q66DRAFT_321129 [Benniella sp.]|nr:MAG: hypothetical protein J3Q66DRAFT_321129 [Benniella sp.]